MSSLNTERLNLRWLVPGDEAIGICGLFRRDNLDDPNIGFAVLLDHCGKAE